MIDITKLKRDLQGLSAHAIAMDKTGENHPEKIKDILDGMEKIKLEHLTPDSE